MKISSTETKILGSPDDVWTVLTDFARYPEWNPFIREASGQVAVGERLTVRIQPPGGRPMTFRPVVKLADAGRELRWLGRVLVPGLFDGDHRFHIDGVSASEVGFRQSERFRGLLVPLFPASMYEQTRLGFEAMNRALKARVERGTSAPPRSTQG